MFHLTDFLPKNEHPPPRDPTLLQKGEMKFQVCVSEVFNEQIHRNKRYLHFIMKRVQQIKKSPYFALLCSHYFVCLMF